MELNVIYNENCLTGLKKIPDNSIDCCVTSPPYWGLRDYGTAKWVGGDSECNHDSARVKTRFDYEISDKQKSNKGTDVKIYKNTCDCGAIKQDEQLGGEEDFLLFIDNLSNVFLEIKRVLKETGTCFINLGDTYGGSGAGTTLNADTDKYIEQSKQIYVLPNGTSKSSKLRDSSLSKSLLMIPERFAISMIANGWCLRNQIIWHKPNQMPSSVKDRFTVDFEKIFFFVKKSTGYYFEQQLEDAIGYDGRKQLTYEGGKKDVSIGKHTRWKSHKNTDLSKGQQPNSMHLKREMGLKDDNYFQRNKRTVWSINTEPFSEAHFATYPQTLVELMIKSGCPDGGVVLDPFMGAGTTGLVARKLNRNYIGFELNSDYIQMAEKRIAKEMGLFH